MLELYRWEPNMFSLKPLVVLHEKGLAFEDRYVDFLSLAHFDLAVAGALEVKYNPESDGPVLVDRGTAMTESFFISLYLDEAYPETPLRPKDAHGRWRILMWARFVNEVMAPAVSTLGAHKYLVPALKDRRETIEKKLARLPTQEARDGWRTALDDTYSQDLLADSRRKLGLAVNKVEETFAGSDWLAGDAFSLADIDAFSMLRPVPYLAADLLAGAPRTTAWLARMEARPSIKTALGSSRTGKPHEAFTPGPEHSRWG
ncbi:MAG TPA: glutathione S-transferase family protein [Rhizomicrobium sp.]|nr:glutathione S-transferase family protein [Rhizomicrobium sp.]